MTTPTTSYLGTSAAMKLVVEEAESEALVAGLLEGPRRLVASWLLHTELHCAAGRHPARVSAAGIGAVLETVVLAELAAAARAAGLRVLAPAGS